MICFFSSSLTSPHQWYTHTQALIQGLRVWKAGILHPQEWAVGKGLDWAPGRNFRAEEALPSGARLGETQPQDSSCWCNLQESQRLPLPGPVCEAPATCARRPSSPFPRLAPPGTPGTQRLCLRSPRAALTADRTMKVTAYDSDCIFTKMCVWIEPAIPQTHSW